MESYSILYSIAPVLYGIAQIILLFASIVLFIRKKNLISVIILFSAAVSIFLMILNWAWIYFGPLSEGGLTARGIINIFGGLAHILFAIGFFLLILQFYKKTV